MPILPPSRLPLIATAVWLACTAWPLSSLAQVFRCGNSYSSTPCADGKPVPVEPIVEVHPPTQGAAERRATRRHADREERAWDRMERELDKAQAKAPPQRKSGVDRSQCEARDRRIQKIDQLARRGGTVQQMERLREERQEARDWQFRAGC